MLASANVLLTPSGFQLVRRTDEFEDYIPFEQTQAAATAAGLSVGDYIDREYNVPGCTQDTIDQMAELGAFDRPICRVCEIGPGSGRYLEKVIARCAPQSYEIYETAGPWRDWLTTTYNVTARPTDGVKLSATPDGTVDLVHSHKVLNGLKILDICSYFYEIARIAGPESVVVFDILTEDCLDEDTLRRWLDSGAGYVTSMTTKQFAVDFFGRRGFECVGSFFATSMPGKTHYLVFKR
ncbi:methyltransferase domain-containing protein [Nocardia ninae]|uniref:Methyltransferase type 11 domain-containing protein n=1 Tax=Nocardia ninae NBRC 108245 TaxID=1210091 RepID=A0A511M7B1_9NOCA|nr:hypothetical protein NN4_09900 [Nocardia ninae NBRC 108245]